MTRSSEPQPLRSLLDEALQRVPIHVFILDGALVCRYAAPAGETFLGLPRERLVGLDIGAILPPARNGLRPALHGAARQGVSWTHPAHEYRHQSDEGEVLYVWAIRVEPVALHDERGVLLTLQDIAEHIAARTRVEIERDRLLAVTGILERQLASHTRRAQELCAKVRNVVAPISGYLQVIAHRRALLGGQSIAEMIDGTILPQLRAMVDLLDAFDASVSLPSEDELASDRELPREDETPPGA